jgi:antirestriction protein
MRIYVACLASYNAGRLFGEWIDCEDKSGDDIREAITAMIERSPAPDAEEWAIHDYDGIPSGYGENPDLDDIATYCEMYGKHGAAWDAYVEWIGATNATESHFENAYLGEADTATEYAERYADDTGMLDGIPENLRYYFDYEAFGRDMEMNGDITIQDGYVFSGNC